MIHFFWFSSASFAAVKESRAVRRPVVDFVPNDAIAIKLPEIVTGVGFALGVCFLQ